MSHPNIVPGDVIEWVYKFDGVAVLSNEELWSSTMECWVPIGGTALLISVDDETYSWLGPEGFLRARADDTLGSKHVLLHVAVLPRARR